MMYNERFNGAIKTKKFETEEKMEYWVNENFDDIEIIQIYTTVSRSSGFSSTEFLPVNNFHIMFRTKIKKEKVTI